MEKSGEGLISLLLVDDDADMAAVTRRHLARLNEAFDVTVENDAASGLEVLDEEIDCVVSDYEMPEMDGLDFLREVRVAYPDLPFILFTGRGSEEIASKAISAGVTDYLQKGTGLERYDVLANRIENAVDRRRSQAVAAETEGRYRTLVESSPHAVIVHTGGEIIYVNDRVLDLLDAEGANEVIGTDPIEYVHPDDREAIRSRASEVIHDGEEIDWFEFRVVSLDEEVCWVESRAAPVYYEGHRASQVVLRDVTERHRREQRLEALHEATSRLATAEDHEDVARVAVTVLEEVFEDPIGVVWRYDQVDDRLVPLAATDHAATLAGADTDTDAGVPPLPADAIEMDVYEAGEPRVLTDYPTLDGAFTDDIQTTYLVPLDGHGMVGVGAEECRTFDPTERELVGILARSVTAALDRMTEERSPDI